MIRNKGNVSELACYYKHGTSKPNTPLKCIGCRCFGRFSEFFENIREDDNVCIIQGDMSYFTGPCGRCGFPDCDSWVERKK